MRSKQFRDPSQPGELRARDLLERMTLEEKVAQLGGIWSFRLFEDGAYSAAGAAQFLANGIGQIARPAGGSGYGPEDSARLINTIQGFLIEKTRLGIPAIMHDECLAGFLMKGSSLFPQAIGLASTWDPNSVERMAGVLRKQMRAVGVHQGLSPVLDIARDPRWGRVEETFGEDPYLVASLGTAYVRGLQGESLQDGVLATVKHFAGYSASEGGMNMAPARIPERELREVYLFPFECAISVGGAKSVMNSYSEIDGIPCAMSRKLLTEILRDEWGFEGIVVADYEAIIRLKDHHRLTRDKGAAAKLCLEAGLDIELPDPNCYAAPLIEMVREGRVSEATVDTSVLRVLRMKFRLGLFENPYVDIERAKTVRLPEHRELSLKLARKSVVLLKNDGCLPLDASKGRIALIGPSADEPRNLLSDYAYPAHMELMFAMQDSFIRPLVGLDEIKASVEVTSVLHAITKHVDGDKIVYAKGCDISGESLDGFDKAVEAARACDVAIVVVGDKSGLTLQCTSGETRDVANLKLPGVQEELILAVAETGVPVVLVLASGRPYSLVRLVDKVDAILEIWLPGETGGEALAEILFGITNPSGKLPVTFPRSAGQIPIYYAHKPSGGHSEWWGDYVDESAKPLYPFGHGLSYTTFEYSNLSIGVQGSPNGGAARVAFDVENAGDLDGDEVVQLYVKREYASVTRPVQELKGFKRLTLKPGEKKTLIFEMPSDVLSFYDRDMNLVVEPGRYVVMIGGSSEDIRLTGEFKITDAKIEVGTQRNYFTKVHEEG